jgi:tRNA(adenine34) deaminase
MQPDSNSPDIWFFRQAILQAEQAGRLGNLTIGAVIVLNGEIIARGKNAIWQPDLALTRHAEMEALRAVPASLWTRSREMTLYTTLEPCLMCAGAILLHQLGRLVYGSTDPWGGVAVCLHALPGFFREEFTRIKWEGPALPAECDPLYSQIKILEQKQRVA